MDLLWSHSDTKASRLQLTVQSVDLLGYPHGKKDICSLCYYQSFVMPNFHDGHDLQVLASHAKCVTILFQGFSPLLLTKQRDPKILTQFQVYSLETVLLHFGGKATHKHGCDM